MSVLLLTMGPRLGLVMETPALRVGEAGTIKLRAPGAVGPVKWTVVESDLPAEWGAITPNGAEATINTAEALEWGEYAFTVRAVDSQRVPVMRTFSVWVEPDAIVVAAGGTHDWIVGTPVSLPLAITGGTGVYVSSNVVSGSLPAGITAQVSGSTLQISGTPSAIADDGAVIAVSDSRGAPGVTSVNWEVTSPPKILLGGSFTQISGVARDRIVRLNHDGTLDTSFTTSVTGAVVLRILVLPTGKIMICGLFTHVNGVAKPNIARLHADGTLDTSFHCVPNTTVNDMAPQPDGSIVIVGSFANVNGSSGTQRYARIHADGSTDTSFGPCAASSDIKAAFALPDGRTLVSGLFSTIGGVATSARLALLKADGTVDASFVPALSGQDGGYVNRFSAQTDGKILAAGRVGSVFGSPVSHMFRLNSDLTLDSGWIPLFTSTNSQTFAISQLSNLDVLVAGEFNAIWNGSVYSSRGRVGAIGGSTGLATAFNPNANNTVHVAMEMPDGNILCAGDFTQMSSTARTRIALVTAGGGLVSGFTPTANGSVRAGALKFL